MRTKAGMMAALLILVVTGSSFSLAQETRVRFTLDWAVQGPQAPFLVALERGYFRDEGLNVTIDRGFGSADAVTKVASAAYDMGFADINSMIEFNASNPEQALVAVAMIYNNPPLSILTLRDRDISAPEALAGRTLGAPAGDASRRLFPIFAAATGLDPDSVTWVTMDPPLREPMLIRGDVDAISGFFFTSLLNLTAAGVAADEVVTFLYSDYGVDLYGNAVIAPPALLEENPEAVRGFLRALTRGWQDTLSNPEGAIAVIQERDPLTDAPVERERLMLAIDATMLTPEVMEQGFGAVDMARLTRAIEQVVAAFELTTTPSAESIFNGDFLPPLEERMPPNP